MAWFIGLHCIGDPVAKKLLWLVPLRDLISFTLWCYGFWGDTIKWRDQQFKLTRTGKLIAQPPQLEQVKPLVS